MRWSKCLLSLFAACSIGLAGSAAAQNPIRIGYPVILSGPGALIGEPSLKGAQMFVEEINAKGGVLNRKIELVIRDTKGNADEAVRVGARPDPARERRLPVRHADLGRRPGGLADRQGEQDRLRRAGGEDRSAHGTGEPAPLCVPHHDQHDDRGPHGRRDHGQVEQRQARRHHESRLCVRPGRDTKAFVTHLKKIRPDIEIVDQQWPKLGEADYTPFINAQMAKKPDAVFSSLWGGHFVTFAKQAKALKYFESFEQQLPRRR